MASKKRVAVSSASAQSVQPPVAGIADVTTSVAEEFLLIPTDWYGQYVKIEVETEDHYVACAASAAATITLAAAATETAGVPDRVVAGTPAMFVWPSEGYTHLAYRTVSGTGTIRVRRA